MICVKSHCVGWSDLFRLYFIIIAVQNALWFEASFKIRFYFVALAALLTILIGVGRVYLGVHYPGDVLGAWRIGAAWALDCWVLMTSIQRDGRVDTSPV